MSTANFSIPNTNKHYTIGVDCELCEGEFDMVKESIIEDFENLFRSTSQGGYNPSRNRINLVSTQVEYFDNQYKTWDEMSITVVAEFGYFQGVMFDIELSLDHDDIEVLPKTTQKKINSICNKIEKIFSKYTTKIERVAQFSNGETIYRLA